MKELLEKICEAAHLPAAPSALFLSAFSGRRKSRGRKHQFISSDSFTGVPSSRSMLKSRMAARLLELG